MYYRKIETNRAAKTKHDENQKAAAKFRLVEVARKKKAKKAAKKEVVA